LVNSKNIAGFIAALSAFLLMITLPGYAQKSKKYNVLFIAVDDLKPELGCYGSSVVKSPNINELAASSTTFTSTYCQQAICGPTRASVLTGMRPDRTKIWDLKAKLRDESPDIVSLPQYFKANGYYTLGMGKVFDPSNTDKDGDAISWSVPFKKSFLLAKGYENIAYGIYQSPALKQIVEAEGNEGKEEQEFYGPNKNQTIRYSTECLDIPDNAYMDGAMADYAVEQLKSLKNNKQPFFMAVGFKKPHLPFIAPKKYWDLYERNKIELASFQQKAVNSPDVAYHNSGELRNYVADIKSLDDKGMLLKLPEEKQRELIHGYYACVSYTDAQIGKLLASLKANGLDKNTIIVLWGDHGWHLGDHSLWCKHSNFEQATKVPLIIKAPGITKGKKFTGLTEFVDIFPTVCQLAGLPVNSQLDGKSLLPVLKNNSIKGKEHAISQYPRGAGDGPKEIMGYSIRNKRYRFTEWIKGFTTNKVFDEKNVVAVELYDYNEDPDETKNMANEPEMALVIKEMSAELHNYYKTQFTRINKNK
jgi:arylsulfatase A-like enzyme